MKISMTTKTSFAPIPAHARTSLYKVYTFLFNKYHSPAIVMPLKQCIHNLTHSLLQQGDVVRRRAVGSFHSLNLEFCYSRQTD